MPYRVVGKTVEKQERSGRWVTVKRHETREQAERHLRALYANVPDARKERR